jgi:L-malate glycosyltransferase
LSGSAKGRLLHILHIDPERNWGGGETQVFGLLDCLSRRGHENHLLTHPDGKLLQETKRLNVRAFPIIVRNDVDVRAVPGIRRLIRNQRYDVVHFHTKRAHALAPWLPHGPMRPKYVVTRRMDYPQARNWYTACLYNRSVDAVIAISRPIADILLNAGVQADKVRVVHSGIDPTRFEAPIEPAEPSVPTIGCIAHLETRKGHRHLLEAARLLKESGHRFNLVIAGTGSLEPGLREQSAALHLSDRVTFAGFVSDVPRLLSTIDLFVLPSLYEGLGVAALEAMAAGKAVVASRVGGLAEIVVERETGFLVPPADPAALADAIAKLLADPQLRSEFGRHARARVRNGFTLEHMASETEACYYELLDRAA